MSCTPIATSTRTDVITTNTVTTSFSSSISTAPPGTTTVTSTTCLTFSTANSSSTCLSSSDVTVTSTIPGTETTIQVPFTLTLPITTSSTTTLFTTSCSSLPPSQPPTSLPPSSPVVSTPPSILTTSSSTTLADGSVSIVYSTITSTAPPTGVVMPTTAPQTQPDSGRTSTNNIGPVIGGVLGGFFGLIGIVALIWFIIRRRRTWDDIFEKDSDGHQRFELDDDLSHPPDPKPYQYGLVGHVPAPPPVPSASPPPGTLPPGNINTLSAHRGSSAGLAPLTLSYTPSTPPPSSRPSTAGSTAALLARPSEFGVRTHSRSPSASQTGHARTSSASASYTTHGHTYSTGTSSSITSPPVTHANPWGVGPPVLPPPPGAGGVGYGGEAEESDGETPTLLDPPRRLQLVNAGPMSPTASVFEEEGVAAVRGEPSSPMKNRGGPSQSGGGRVVQHTDGGRIPETSGEGAPPGYDS